MGANIMPTAKKMGRTVFGVRIGLSQVNLVRFLHVTNDSLPCFQSLLAKGIVYTISAVVPEPARATDLQVSDSSVSFVFRYVGFPPVSNRYGS